MQKKDILPNLTNNIKKTSNLINLINLSGRETITRNESCDRYVFFFNYRSNHISSFVSYKYFFKMYLKHTGRLMN